MRYGFPLLLASLFFLQGLHAQQLQVLDDRLDPVIGATVQVFCGSEEAVATTVTDEVGGAALNLDKPDDCTVELRYVGYETVRMPLAEALLLPQVILRSEVSLLAEAQVVAVRAKPTDPFAFTNVDGDALAEANVGQDIPMLLRRTPGAVFTSDAGTGIGYSGFRVRGADATRINVTINGVPLNDSESQGVFWVNMPDFVSSTSSLQLQRGVGESTYGAGAFGANLNLVTDVPTAAPSLEAELAGGSFGTARGMLKASTGESASGFSASGRLSYITSDGFVDRASAELGAAYLGTSWAINDSERFQLIGWTGKERTYQSWFGVPRANLDNDDLITFNPAGARGDGTFYEDQVDNYRQSHGQALYSRQLAGDWLLQLTGHYTKGRGFFEEYEAGSLGDLPFQSAAPDAGDTAVIQYNERLWLDNDFYGAIVTVSTSGGPGALSRKLNTTFSAGYNEYRGDHFGEVIRFESPTQFNETVTVDELYRNDAVKRSFNAFAKTVYEIGDGVSMYQDFQVRQVSYEFEGLTRDLEVLPATADFLFFNPKIGLSWTGGAGQQLFASLAVGQREPNRRDFRDSPIGAEPKAEQLVDYELGFRAPRNAKYAFEANAYYMDFSDQLVPTGELNDVGGQARRNVDNSYRIGLEIAGAYSLTPAWSVEGNVSLSRSVIESFDEFVYDFSGTVVEVLERRDVPTGFSPDLITNLGLRYRGQVGAGLLDLALWGNTVSEQYLDNSGSDEVLLPSYGRLDLEGRYTIRTAKNREVTFSLQLQNLNNNNPATNGYAYRYLSPGVDATTFDPYVTREEGDRFVGVGVYPQAGFTALVGLRLGLTRIKS